PNPVADRREVSRLRRLVAKAPADLGPAVGVAGDPGQPALFLHHTRPLQVREFRSADLIFEEVVPAKPLALRHDDAPFQKRWKCRGSEGRSAAVPCSPREAATTAQPARTATT